MQAEGRNPGFEGGPRIALRNLRPIQLRWVALLRPTGATRDPTSERWLGLNLFTAIALRVLERSHAASDT